MMTMMGVWIKGSSGPTLNSYLPLSIQPGTGRKEEEVEELRYLRVVFAVVLITTDIMHAWPGRYQM